MTARDVIAEMRKRAAWLLAMRSGLSVPSADCVAREAEALTGFADRLESTLAQPSGEAVAWQEDMPGLPLKWSLGAYVIEYSGAEDEPYYAAFSADDHLDDYDTLEAAQAACYAHARQHYSGLFATPPAPLGGLTEAESVGREMLEYIGDDLADDRQHDDDNALLTVGQVRTWSRRLTAPRAEGVEDTMVEELRELLEAPFNAECCNNAFPIAMMRRVVAQAIAALTAAAPKVEE